MNEVYVIAGGEWLRNNLNAIAAFMGTRTWDSIEKIALTLSVLAVAVMWVQRHNVMDLLGWVGAFVRHQLRHCRAADAGSQPPAVPGGRQSGTSGAGRLPAGRDSGA
ncbi:putative traG protein [Escherichia coli BCE006_MS-23]|nr:putative traG protein [Escherichia coli BCE019_MS-13]ENB19315.1 putative traG protein [Escherichia coli BCE030_MS-09]ENB26740.1 putative traG protein [Escherichia coli BCE032_MS-12]END48347.1 putative traG protein [Escherichia coli BCE006_MS-23]